MNIENLKNMPVVGEDPAGSAMVQIATAISAAGDNAIAFVTALRAEKETNAAENAAERAKQQADNLTASNQDITDHNEKYAEVKKDYFEAIEAVIASITENNDGDLDSIKEGNDALVAASLEMDNKFLNFKADEVALNEAFQAEIGTAQEVANILAGIEPARLKADAVA